jgi:lipopolysaccharide export system protein LptC
MAFEANLVPAGQRYRVRSAEERERAFIRAAGHSRQVRILRKALPLLAVLVLAAYFISTRLNVTVGDVTASISGMEMADGNLRMTNPKLEGADKKNGKYVVSAEYADQDVKNPSVIKLHTIKADLSSPSGGWSRMEAVRGVFNTKAERLVMQDKITVATSAGVTGELQNASLDMKNQTLRSHLPVFFKLTNGTVRANALTLQSSDHTLTFRGKVAVHLIRQKKEGGDGTPHAKQASPQLRGTLPAATGAAPGENSGAAQTVNPR